MSFASSFFFVSCLLRVLSFFVCVADGGSLYHYKGPRADVSKLKWAVRAIAALRKERLKKIKVVSMKRHDEDLPEFWQALQGAPADVKVRKAEREAERKRQNR